MKIDLGGIAKGYAIDRGARVLKDNGVIHFLLNAGGDIYVSGKKDAQNDWRIGVKHPRNENELVADFNFSNGAVATSGDYERFVEINGQRLHHILDPRTGRPAKSCQSATVIAESAEKADVLATFLFIAGVQKAEKFLPEKTSCLFIDEQNQFFASGFLKGASNPNK